GPQRGSAGHARPPRRPAAPSCAGWTATAGWGTAPARAGRRSSEAGSEELLGQQLAGEDAVIAIPALEGGDPDGHPGVRADQRVQRGAQRVGRADAGAEGTKLRI